MRDKNPQNLENRLADKEREIVGSAKQDLVDEKKVEKKLQEIESRLDVFPESFKKPIQGKLKEVEDKWKSKLEDIDSEGEDQLKELGKLLQKELDEFENIPEVKDYLYNFEPFFKNKEAILPIINLDTYGRRSGDYKKINFRLSQEGISENRIRKIQEKLNVKIDGKVGPQTIKALGEMYGEPIEVKWENETKYEGGTQIDFNKEYDELKKQKDIEAEDAHKLSQIYEDVEEAYKKADTAEDVEEAEEKAEEFIEEKAEAEEAAAEAAVEKATKEPTVEEPTVTKPEESTTAEPTAVEKLAYEEKEAELDEYAEKHAKIQFGNIQKILQISDESLHRYFKEYIVNKDKNELLSPKEITKKIRDLKRLTGYIQNGEQKKQILFSALGKLVNGMEPTREYSQIGTAVEESETKTKEEYGKQMAKNNKELVDLYKNKMNLMGMTVSMTSDNPEWTDWVSSFWASESLDKGDQIDENIETINELDAKIQKIEKAKEKARGKMKERLDKFYKHKLYLVKAADLDPPAQFYLDAEESYANIGEDVPTDGVLGEIAQKLEEIKVKMAESPLLTEIQKAVLLGKTDEAIQLLKEKKEQFEKEETTEYLGNHFRSMSEADIISLYDKNEHSAIMFQSTSFVRNKIKEGYKYIKLKDTEDRMDDYGHHRGMGSALNLLVKKEADGSYKYLFCSKKGEEISQQSFSEEQTIPKDRAEKIQGNQTELNTNIQEIMQGMPAIKKMESAASILNNKFAALQSLFKSGQKGSKTLEYVRMAKRYAKEIKGNSELARLGLHAKDAIKELKKFKGLVKGQNSEFERKLDEKLKQLQSVADNFEGNKINQFCDQILTADYDDDSFVNWVLKEGIPFAGAIVFATGAIIAIPVTGGKSAYAAWIALGKMSVIGAAGGMVGQEVGTFLGESIGQGLYDENFENKTLLGQYLSQEISGEEGPIEGWDVLSSYSKQFVKSTLLTFATLGIATQVVSPRLMKFVEANRTNEKVLGRVARQLEQLPRLHAKTVDIADDVGMRKFLTRLIRESSEEFGEESAQEVSNQLDSRLGFITGVILGTTANRVNYQLGGFDISQDSSTQTGSEATTHWSYDQNKEADFITKLEQEYSGLGYKITPNSDGTITVESSHETRNGKSYKSTMIFTGTQESIGMRRLTGPTGDPDLKKLYGVEKTGDREYVYSNANPDGKVNLESFLEYEGFIISVDVEGQLIATKGDDEVVLRPKKPDPSSPDTSPDSPGSDTDTSTDSSPEFESDDTLASIENQEVIGNSSVGRDLAADLTQEGEKETELLGDLKSRRAEMDKLRDSEFTPDSEIDSVQKATIASRADLIALKKDRLEKVNKRLEGISEDDAALNARQEKTSEILEEIHQYREKAENKRPEALEEGVAFKQPEILADREAELQSDMGDIMAALNANVTEASALKIEQSKLNSQIKSHERDQAEFTGEIEHKETKQKIKELQGRASQREAAGDNEGARVIEEEIGKLEAENEERAKEISKAKRRKGGLLIRKASDIQSTLKTLRKEKTRLEKKQRQHKKRKANANQYESVKRNVKGSRDGSMMYNLKVPVEGTKAAQIQSELDELRAEIASNESSLDRIKRRNKTLKAENGDVQTVEPAASTKPLAEVKAEATEGVDMVDTLGADRAAEAKALAEKNAARIKEERGIAEAKAKAKQAEAVRKKIRRKAREDKEYEESLKKPEEPSLWPPARYTRPMYPSAPVEAAAQAEVKADATEGIDIVDTLGADRAAAAEAELSPREAYLEQREAESVPISSAMAPRAKYKGVKGKEGVVKQENLEQKVAEAKAEQSKLQERIVETIKERDAAQEKLRKARGQRDRTVKENPDDVQSQTVDNYGNITGAVIKEGSEIEGDFQAAESAIEEAGNQSTLADKELIKVRSSMRAAERRQEAAEREIADRPVAEVKAEPAEQVSSREAYLEQREAESVPISSAMAPRAKHKATAETAAEPELIPPVSEVRSESSSLHPPATAGGVEIETEKSPEERVTEAIAEHARLQQEIEDITEEDFVPAKERHREALAEMNRLARENPDEFQSTTTDSRGNITGGVLKAGSAIEGGFRATESAIEEADAQRSAANQKIRQTTKLRRAAKGRQEAAEREIEERPPVREVQAAPAVDIEEDTLPSIETSKAEAQTKAVKAKSKPKAKKVKKPKKAKKPKGPSLTERFQAKLDKGVAGVKSKIAAIKANRVESKKANLPKFTPGEMVRIRYRGDRNQVVEEKGWKVINTNEDGTVFLESIDGRTWQTTREQLTFANPKGGLKAAYRNGERLPFKEVKRRTDVIAIPDTHGDFEAFRGALKNNGLINEKGEWIGGEKRVQILGDIFDRGPDSMKILKQIAKYKKAGVQIDLLIGNHEDFVLKAMLGQKYDSSDMMMWWKYGDDVQKKVITDRKIPEYVAKHREVLEIFRESKLVEQVDDVLYMHGELSDEASALIDHYGVDGINKQWQIAVGQALDGDPGMLEQVSKDFHPLFWSRAISEGGESDSSGIIITAHNQAKIGVTLKENGINLVVHGHTPTGRAIPYEVGGIPVINIDTAASRGMRGRGETVGKEYEGGVPLRSGGLTVTKKTAKREAGVIVNADGQKQRAM